MRTIQVKINGSFPLFSRFAKCYLFTQTDNMMNRHSAFPCSGYQLPVPDTCKNNSGTAVPLTALPDPFSRPVCVREAILFQKEQMYEKVEIRAWFSDGRLQLSCFRSRMFEPYEATLWLEAPQVESLLAVLGLPGSSQAELLLALQHYFSRDYFDAFRRLLEREGLIYGLLEN